jgi:hypothetical protein
MELPGQKAKTLYGLHRRVQEDLNSAVERCVPEQSTLCTWDLITWPSLLPLGIGLAALAFPKSLWKGGETRQDELMLRDKELGPLRRCRKL